MSSESPIRVAILGGGCAGVTAAFELTRPEHAGKYQVTVYQQGWRLGGKGASGRGPRGRIEEHGLHLWMGFYENAFQLMRECYAELARDPKLCRIASWQDAFIPDHFCGVMDRSPSGAWRPWAVAFPAMPGLPGEPHGAQRWTVGDYLSRAVSLLLTLMRAIQAHSGEDSASSNHPAGRGAETSSDAVIQSISRWLRYGELASLTGIVSGLEILDSVARALPNYPRDLILSFHQLIASAVRAELHARTDSSDELRRLWEIVDLSLAAVRGIIRFGLVTDPRGFDAIDEYDCREWLKMNGASERSVQSAFVRALYDLAFAYEGGDVRRPRIAAGQALRGAMRAFFTYRGAFFWKMQAGMGDVVFAPFYEVLKRRGVKFEFFHRLTNIALAPASTQEPGEKPYVQALEFEVQAAIQGESEYHPLVDVRGLPCWPSNPDWSQLVDGERLREEGWAFESHWECRQHAKKRLKVTEDFDLVVLAVGLGAIPHVAAELVQRSPRWQQMLRTCGTVATQAFQLWMKVDMKDLGWNGEQINLSGYVEPFDTWADMRQLIQEESFDPPARAVAYFCGVLPDPSPGTDVQKASYRDERHQEVRSNAVSFLNTKIVELWPKALSAPNRFRWEVLCDPESSTLAGVVSGTAPQEPNRATPNGEERLDTQFWTANVNPTDRYCLSLPGSLKDRVSPLHADFENLTVAGDWTDSGFNEGCVEAAVLSGRLAAHAISKRPSLEEIPGYDHP